MNSEAPIFGARAEVFLRFDGELDSLATKLRKDGRLVPFDVQTSEWPPHVLVGSCEALGFEVWLEQSSCGEYLLRMETEHCLQESFHGLMHDLSMWLARYVSEICGVDAVVRPRDGGERLFPRKERM